MSIRDDVLLGVTKRRLGRQLGSFRLEAVVAVGAVSAMYTGVRADGARAAVRVLHPDVSVLPDATERFFEGGREVNRVGHAGAVRILEDGVAEGDPFVVMPLVEGRSIAALAAQRGGRISVSDGVRVAGTLLEILGRAHEKGIVHGDVQPDNLLLTQRGIRLLDFGMAHVRRLAAENGLRAHVAANAVAARIGSGIAISAAADLASVGATLHTLLTGEPLPAPGASIAPVAWLDPALAAIVAQALGRGFASASAMRAALALVDTNSSEAEVPASAPAPVPVPVPAPVPAPASVPRGLPVPAAMTSSTGQMRAVRPNPADPGRDLAALRAFFAAAARCLACGSPAIAEGLRFEAEAPPHHPPAEAPAATSAAGPVRRGSVTMAAVADPARAAREAARPDAARWFLRAHEAAAAALAAGESVLLWTVGPRAFELHGQPVWQPSIALERVPARLFASGVRALGLRRGIEAAEVGELLRLFAAAAEGDPRIDGDLAGVLWEANLEHLVIEAEEDPLGLLDGDPGDDLRAERAWEIEQLGSLDAAVLEQNHARLAGRGEPFAPRHQRIFASRSLPATIRLTSRRSSMSRACALALRSMISSARAATAGGSARVRRMLAQPRMDVSGVRSSWLSIERNSSLARFSASATARALTSASYERARSSAWAHCRANAIRKARSSSSNRCGSSNTRPMAPSMRPWAARGMAASALSPGCCLAARFG
jgi:serine/threonine-protein kinase